MSSSNGVVPQAFSWPRWALVPNLALLAMLGVAIAGNQAVFLAWNHAAQALPTWFWANLTVLGDTLVAFALVLPFTRRRPELAAVLLVATLLATLAVHGIKPFLDLPRPAAVLAPGSFELIGARLRSHAFPSGHSTTIFVLAALAGSYLARPGALLLAVGSALLIGVSRVAVGAHWPLDVFGGALAGWIAGLAGVWAVHQWGWLRGPGLRRAVQAVLLAGTAWLLIAHHTGYAEAERMQRVVAFLALTLFLRPEGGTTPDAWLRRHALYAAFMACGVVFLALPEIDLWASGRFWNAEQGFFLAPLLEPIHVAVPWFTRLLVVVLGGGFLLASLVSAPWARRKSLLYLLLVLVVGPGLLVNALFKDHWGRARPAQVENFGGLAQFSPPWVKVKQCAKNCSFTCGDASVGFALLAPAFIWARRRRLWLGVGLAAGGLLGLMRMAQGGHFFSDVVFSGFLVYFAAWLLHRWLYPEASRSAAASS